MSLKYTAEEQGPKHSETMDRVEELERRLRKANEALSGREEEISRLQGRLRLMDIEMAIYREIGSVNVGGKDMNQMLEHLMDLVLDAVGTDAGTIYLLDGSTSSLVFSVVKGPVAGKLKGKRIPLDGGIAGWVAKTGKAYISDSPAGDAMWNKEFEVGTGYSHRGLMAVPIKVNEEILGVVEVINKREGESFSGRDLDVLMSLANHVAIILDKGRLILELDKRVRQFSTLTDVGNLLISSLDTTVITRRAIEAITGLMDAEAGSLLLVDDVKKELFFKVALGEKGEKVKEVRLRMGEGIAGWVAQHGDPLLIHDVKNDPRFAGKFDERSEFTTNDMMCIPVKLKGRIIGVLQAINKRNGVFAEEDMDIFLIFSNQVAIALDNARLYEELRETFYTTAEALADAIEKRDPYTGGHTKRVMEYSVSIAKYMNLSSGDLNTLKLSAILHDIGKIGVEDKILKKNARLEGNEIESMNMHPAMGAEIVRHIKQLQEVIPGMLYHHERMDGKGYPEGLTEEAIPLIAKIISVADAYDAMTTTRPYREGLHPALAFDEIKKEAGKQFYERAVEAFIKAFDNGEIA